MMTGVFHLEDMNENVDCDNTPFYEQWPGLEGNPIGGPSHAPEGSRRPGPLPRHVGMPGPTHRQQRNLAQGPSRVQERNPTQDPLQRQKVNHAPVPFYGGNPVPGPSQEQEGNPASVLFYRGNPVPGSSQEQEGNPASVLFCRGNPVPGPLPGQEGIPAPVPFYRGNPVPGPSQEQEGIPAPVPFYRGNPVPGPSQGQEGIPAPVPFYGGNPVPGPSQGQAGNPAPVPFYRENPVPGPSQEQEGNPASVLFYRGNPVPGPLPGQEGIPAPVLFYRGNPVPGPSQGQEGIPAPVPFYRENPVPGSLNGAGNSRKRTRTNFTTEQLRTLEEAYTVSHICSRRDRTNLSIRLNIQEKIIKVWFQNRRMKEKKEMKEKQVSGKMLSLSNPQPAHSTQDNHDNNGREYSFTVPLPLQYWQAYASRQNQYPISGSSGSAPRVETVTTQSASNVQTRRSSNEATSTYCENRQLVMIDKETVTNQLALSQATVYERHSSNEATPSYHKIIKKVSRKYQNPASGNSSVSKLEALTGQSASTSQERRASTEPTSTFGETYEPRHHNVRVSYDSESLSEIENSESSNSPQSCGNPREHSNKRNRYRVTTTNIRVSEGDNVSCKSLSSSEEKGKKQSYVKWNEEITKEDTYELPQHAFSTFFIGPSVPGLQYIDNVNVYSTLFGVDRGVYLTECYPPSGQLYDMGTAAFATNVYGTEWNINN